MASMTSGTVRQSRYTNSVGSFVWSISRTKPSVPPTHSTTRGAPIGSCLLRAVQDAQGLLVQLAVADKDVRSVDRWRPVPVAETAAGLLDDDLQGSHVPGADAVLDHHLTGALGHEHETVEVAEAALPLRPRHQVEEGVAAAGLHEPGNARIVQVGLGQIGDRRDVNPTITAVS